MRVLKLSGNCLWSWNPCRMWRTASASSITWPITTHPSQILPLLSEPISIERSFSNWCGVLMICLPEPGLEILSPFSYALLLKTTLTMRNTCCIPRTEGRNLADCNSCWLEKLHDMLGKRAIASSSQLLAKAGTGTSSICNKWPQKGSYESKGWPTKHSWASLTPWIVGTTIFLTYQADIY